MQVFLKVELSSFNEIKIIGDILAQSESMKGDLAEFSQGVRGRIRLLSNTAGLSEVLPTLVATYLIDNPNVDLDVEERQSHEIIDAIRSGSTSFAKAVIRARSADPSSVQGACSAYVPWTRINRTIYCHSNNG
jgi:DNA-binding transcriptional LysR family regulator